MTKLPLQGEKNIILCADDFGMTPEVSRGVLKLIDKKRLSAVSCMSNYPDWQHSAKALKSYHDRVSIGLHFNLPGPLPLTIAKAYMRLCSRRKIKQALQAQYDDFYAQMGFAPDYLDGHQHIHALPVIRDIVLSFWQKNCPGKPVRVTRTPQRNLKAMMINLLGARKFERLCVKHQVPHNVNLLGIYNFNTHANYAQCFRAFLAQGREGSLVMCHPGEAMSTAMSCQNELRYFLSNTFVADLEAYQVELRRFD